MSLPTSSAPPHAVWKPSKSTPIPITDILTFAFANLGRYDNDQPIFIDATDPSRSISALRALHVVRRLIKGLKELGLKEGDCVCLHAFNNVSTPLVRVVRTGLPLAPKFHKLLCNPANLGHLGPSDRSGTR
ncbi:hypothetical protein HRR78_008274 [Exophiala dermatitidis]|nr:hypothetical protein HRR75_008337 [Exophiala dermatitidis]KAJ4538213.1 hypothetical protein HRR78_008274 [Exophiala dermatitidis]